MTQKNVVGKFVRHTAGSYKCSVQNANLTAVTIQYFRECSLLTDLMGGVQSKSGVQGTPRTGIAQGKDRKQIEMINLAVAVAQGDVHSSAVAQGDDNHACQTDLEPSDLVNTAEAFVGPRCREIYTLAQAHAAALVAFGTTAAELSALDAAITTYDGLATAPRRATAVSSSVTADIAREIQAGSPLLKNELDKATMKFRQKNPDFYRAFKDARCSSIWARPQGTRQKEP